MQLIDANELLDDLRCYLYDDDELEYSKNHDKDLGYNNGLKCAIRRVKYHAKTIDAVPVVRCVDCKYRCTLVCPMYHVETCLDDLDGFDDYNVDRTDDDGFCHLGERWEGEENAAD